MGNPYQTPASDTRRKVVVFISVGLMVLGLFAVFAALLIPAMTP